jgi:hypothetical protein
VDPTTLKDFQAHPPGEDRVDPSQEEEPAAEEDITDIPLRCVTVPCTPSRARLRITRRRGSRP